MKNYSHKGMLFSLRIVISLLFTFGLLTYLNTFANEFVWDDEFIIVNNPLIKDFRFLSQIFSSGLSRGDITIKSNYFRPLQALSYLVDYSIWRLNPFGYHLTNVILHIVVSILIYYFLFLLTEDKFVSLISALLFVIHPIHTEAVSYISGRADSLCAIFLLGAFILFVKYRDIKQNQLYLGALLCFILALLSKELALVFPFIIILYDHILLNKNRDDGFLNKIKSYAPFFLIGIIYIFLRITLLNFAGRFFSPAEINMYLRFLTTAKSIIKYIVLLILPLDLHLERTLAISHSFKEPAVFISLITIISIIMAAFRHKKNQPLFCFGCFWFFITLLPQSYCVFPDVIMAEHFLYLPSIGFFLVLSLSLVRLFRVCTLQIKKIILFLFICLVIFYVTISWTQNLNWANNLTFYRWILKFSPQSFRIHNNLGIVYDKMGFYKEAVEEYKKAIKASPNYLNAHNNLANTHLKIGLFEESIQEYQYVLRFNPRLKEVRDNLAVACDMAIIEYQKKLKSNPQNRAAIHYNLGVIYEIKGLFSEAKQEYEKATSLDSKLAAAFNNLGNIYEKEGLFEQALANYKQAIRAQSDFAEGYYNIGVILGNQGKLTEAIDYWQKALRVNSGYKKASESIEKAKIMLAK